MKNVPKILENQRKTSFDRLEKGACTIIMQDDYTGKIKKYPGYCEPSKYGEKIIFCCTPYEDNYTTLEYRQKGRFASGRDLKNSSVYETQKHFVRNENFLDKDLNNRLYHSYMKKTLKNENKLYKEFGKPIKTKKYNRFWS